MYYNTQRILCSSEVIRKYTENFFFFFFLRYRGLNPGAFYLWATSPALFFILYFETGSHEVAEGLAKERERERERERKRERERESGRESQGERERESLGWLRTGILRSPPPKVLGLQACATTPGQPFLFWNKLSLSCQGWPWTCDPPVSALQVPWLEACATMPS